MSAPTDNARGALAPRAELQTIEPEKPQLEPVMVEPQKPQPKPRKRDLYREELDSIYVPPGRRPIRPDTVAALAESMREVGLLHPILVRHVEGKVTLPDGGEVDSAMHLVAGRHRLEAARLLGWEEIDCEIVDLSDRRARMVEITENLHRKELTALEQSIQIAEWIRLSEEERQAARVAPPVLADGRKAGPQHQQRGARAAARELNLDRAAVQRAEKIATLPAEVQAEATSLGLDDNQSALLKAAKAATTDEQIGALRNHAAPKPPAPKAAPPSRPATSGRSSARRRDEAIVALIPLLRAKPEETAEDIMHVLADEPGLAALPFHRRVELGRGLIKALALSPADLRSPIPPVAAVAPPPAPVAPEPVAPDPHPARTATVEAAAERGIHRRRRLADDLPRGEPRFAKHVATGDLLQAVRLEMKRLGIKVTELAERIGRSESYVANVINGWGKPLQANIEERFRRFLDGAEPLPTATPDEDNELRAAVNATRTARGHTHEKLAAVLQPRPDGRRWSPSGIGNALSGIKGPLSPEMRAAFEAYAAQSD
ncbi:MAG TPA: ParB N-terminal domain-containing protein [Stellaceae bacterium]|nr:ParB N-terminal domain-containing protein [Stellaceae bacterium]